MTDTFYQELQFPNYVNNATAVTLRARIDGEVQKLTLSVSELIQCMELAGLNGLIVSDTGRGKTQLLTDIAWHHFGGDQEKGNVNWADGRPGFDITDLFERQHVDLRKGCFDSETARQVKEERTRRLLFGVDELNRAPTIKQNEFFDLAEGKYTFVGRRLALGCEGYSIFIATANLNKLNGDFTGTFQLDRALLNRAHITLDLDHLPFRPTPEDKMIIEERKANPKVDVPPPQDLSNKIIAANKEIVLAAKRLEPYALAFRFLIDEGLDYCDKDKYHEKSAFPMLCADCTYSGKEMCSRIKSSSDRTTPAVKALAQAFSYMARLKTGKYAEIDTFDALLQAFKFTTYHGNLNEIIAQEEYVGRKQAMMDETVEKLTKQVELFKEYMPALLQGHKPVIIQYQDKKGKDIITPHTQQFADALTQNKIAYTTRNLKDELKSQGIGTGWIDAYVRKVGVQK
ncbi:MAG: hypothetical protein HY363_01365 [Candidatus Aenigmarchaeota archaeon]|nr:hypothetical protein [Candidatus Aenigmarchaeota archaeon]